MKIGIGFVFLSIVIMSVSSAAQERNRDTTVAATDSIRYTVPLLTSFGDFEIYRKLYFMKSDIPADNDPKSIWLWTSASISNSSFSRPNSEQNIDNALSPFHRFYVEQSKFNPVRYFLGMAQTTAAGYLAYKAIKKYGFWKKK